jgi:hypothetical protein
MMAIKATRQTGFDWYAIAMEGATWPKDWW